MSTEISAESLYAQLGLPAAPVVIDVRSDADAAAIPRIVPGALKRDLAGLDSWIAALSPERRARQARRADYWIRTRKLLRQQIVDQLQRPGREASLSRVTQSLGARTVTSESDWDDPFFDSSEDLVPSRVLETGPGQLT